MFDLIIVGAGPAGTAAAVYAARKQLKTLLVTPRFDGQSSVSPDIHNWIGIQSISGTDLMKSFESHVRAYEGPFMTVKTGISVTSIVKNGSDFTVHAGTESFDAHTVLVCAGSQRRKLDAPGATEFEHKGLTYCATCDGPLFSGQDVVVIGGGNAGFETAAQLLAYCPKVTLLDRGEHFRADEITVQALLKNPAFTAHHFAQIDSVQGDGFASGVTWKDQNSGELHTVPASGVFVEIGLLPNTSMVEGLVELSPIKQIVVDPRTQRTSVPGIWAAGDCTDGAYHQNNIAAGDAVKALEDLYGFLVHKKA
jgi:NADH-dependent peroxiredoxin subunit F